MFFHHLKDLITKCTCADHCWWTWDRGYYVLLIPEYFDRCAVTGEKAEEEDQSLFFLSKGCVFYVKKTKKQHLVASTFYIHIKFLWSFVHAVFTAFWGPKDGNWEKSFWKFCTVRRCVMTWKPKSWCHTVLNLKWKAYRQILLDINVFSLPGCATDPQKVLCWTQR